MDVVNLQSKLVVVDMKVAEVQNLTETLTRDAQTAAASAEMATGLAKEAATSVEGIRKDTQTALSTSSQLFTNSVGQGKAIIDAAQKHMDSNATAGDKYVDAAKAMLAPLQTTAERLTEQARSVDDVTKQANSASDEARKALAAATTFEKAATDFMMRQGEWAKAWTSESVTVQSGGRDSALSRPTVRMRYPEEPFPDYSFAFEMDSPGSGVSLRVTVEDLQTKRTEQYCWEQRRSSEIHGKYFSLGPSKFFMRTDFVYQSFFSDDFVSLRVLAALPAGAKAIALGGCSSTWPK